MSTQRQFYKNVFFLSTNDTVNSSLASVVITGGISIQKNVRISQNLSVGNIMSSGLTTGNINFTGALFQNSVPYVGSQWSGTTGTLLYYGSSASTYVGINTSSPTFNLDISGGARITTGITTGTILSTGITTGNIQSTGLTTGNINFTGALFQNSVPYVGSQWSGTTGTTLYYGSGGNILVGINTTNPTSTLTVNGDLNITGNTTLGNWLFTNGTIANIVTNNVNYGIANTYSGSFIASNNTITPANVTGFSFTNTNIRSFSAKLTVSILRNTGGNLYATFTIDGTQTDSGWTIFTSYDGDITGIDFNITNLGVIQYISTNLTNFTSNIFRYSVTQITNTGTYNTLLNPTVGSYIIDGLSSSNFVSTNFSSSNFHVSNFSTGNLNVDNVNYGIANTFSGTFFASVNGSPVSITQLIFSSINIVSFTINMTVSTSTLFESFTLDGVQTGSGWVLLSTSQGDVTGVVFSINTSTGQINYTSTVVATFRFIVTQTSKTGTYNSLAITTIGNYIMNSLSTTNLFVGNVTVGGNMIPDINITRDLGSSTNRWKDLYLSGNTIDLGGTLISATSGTIAFGSTILTTTTVGNMASSIPNLLANNISTGTIQATSSTIPNLSANNISTGTIQATSSTISNIVHTNISTGSVNTSVGITSSNILVTGLISTNNLFSLTASIQNMISTNISTGTLTSQTATIPNVVSTNLSTGTIQATSSTISNIVHTNLSTGTLQATTATIPNLVSTNLSTGTIQATSSTISNIVHTNISTGTFASQTATIPNLSTNNISTGTIQATSSTISNIVITNISTSSLRGTNGTIGNFAVTSDLYVGGSLIAVNVTTLNMIDTNISTGTINSSVGITTSNILVTGLISTSNLFSTTSTIPNILNTNISTGIINSSVGITTGTILVNSGIASTFNSNTIGNIITTGGNVGINITTPTNILQVGSGGRLRIANNDSDYTIIGTGNVDDSNNTRIVLSGFTRTGISRGGIEYIATTTGYHRWLLNGSASDVMILNSQGNVGIGTTSPQFKLDVSGGSRISSFNSSTNGSLLISGVDSFGQQLCIENTIKGNRTVINNTNSVGNLFAYNYSGSTPLPLILQSPGGSVCINTTSANAKLNINNNTSHSGSGDYSNMTGHIMTIQDVIQYPRILHLSVDSTTSTVFNFQSGKNIFWGEDSDTGTYVFRGRRFNVFGSNTISVAGGYYFNSTTSTIQPFAAGNQSISIFASSAILTQSHFLASSDLRIKNICNEKINLNFIDKIDPVIYTYKDRIKNPKKNIGFIAQNIYEFCPDAVTLHTEIIPDIMKVVKIIEINNNIITIKNEWKLKQNDIIKIMIDEKDTSGELITIIYANENIVKFKHTKIKNNVFIYGRQVNDFHELNYDYVFSLGFAGIKQSRKDIIELKEEIKELKELIKELKDKF